MNRLLISACLLGFDCKYSGGNNVLNEDTLCALQEKWTLMPVCPETAGGLGIPRDPSERSGGKVISCRGADVTEAFTKGAETACRLCERFGCRTALLKERSPSCGIGEIYDGSFSGTVIEGDGLTAEQLRRLGIRLIGESDVKVLL